MWRVPFYRWVNKTFQWSGQYCWALMSRYFHWHAPSSWVCLWQPRKAQMITMIAISPLLLQYNSGPPLRLGKATNMAHCSRAPRRKQKWSLSCKSHCVSTRLRARCTQGEWRHVSWSFDGQSRHFHKPAVCSDSSEVGSFWHAGTCRQEMLVNALVRG